jgi:8-oxo-dGTP pyrophosphatase MutT (NUDIX family)
MADVVSSSFTIHPSVNSFNVTPQTYLASHPDARFNFLATGSIVFDHSTDVPRILLVQRASSDSMPNLWETPGGACDDTDGSILQAVARELREEAGLEATSMVQQVGEPQLFTSRSGKKICKHYFLVTVKQEKDRPPQVTLDPDEHQSFVWASESEVRARRVGHVELAFTTQQQADAVLEGFQVLRKQLLVGEGEKEG